MEITIKRGVVHIYAKGESITVDPSRKNGHLVAVNHDDDKGRPTRIIK